MSKVFLICIFVSVTLLHSQFAKGDFFVEVFETGGGVVFEGSGSVNLDEFSIPAILPIQANVNPEFGIVVGPSELGPLDLYSGVAIGPNSIGAFDLETDADSGSGDLVALIFSGVENGFARLGVPAGYVSDSPLSSTSFYAGQTIDSLGLIPGNYNWQVGGNSIELNITTTIPEPASFAFLMVCTIAGFSRRR